MARHGVAVVRDDNSLVCCRPLEKLRIRPPVQSGVTRGDGVQTRQAVTQTAQDVVIKILIDEKAQHQQACPGLVASRCLIRSRIRAIPCCCAGSAEMRPCKSSARRRWSFR